MKVVVPQVRNADACHQAPPKGMAEGMMLLFASHKKCWADAASPTGYATVGGFPFHVRAISELFARTVLLVPVHNDAPPDGAAYIEGHAVAVQPLPPLPSSGLSRRRMLLAPAYLRAIWQAVRRADAVHAPVPSDVAMVAMVMAVLQQKPLFVRHCGNWLIQRSVTERFLKWFMERFAGGHNVMYATGGGAQPPSRRNPNLHWIFSTSLTARALEHLHCERRLDPERPPRLITVSRQEVDKGTDSVIRSLSLLRKVQPDVRLDVVGDGAALEAFKTLAAEEGVADAVVFHGRVEHGDVLALMQQADLFCYPTRASEGFPKVVLEAMACGLPIVTTPVSVLPHLVGGGSGIILGDDTPESVSEAVATCLQDPARYAAMSAKAVDTASAYTLERWQAELVERFDAAWHV